MTLFHQQPICIKITDHYPVILSIENCTVMTCTNRSKYKFIKIIIYENLNLDLASENWNSVLEYNNPNLSLNCFMNTLYKHIHNNSLVKCYKVQPKIVPWITAVKSIRIRDK